MFTRSSKFLFVLLLTLCSTRPAKVIAADFRQEVIYQIVIDRFVDGDPSNNDPPQSAGLYDPERRNWRAYWGGDLAGIQQKIPYLAALGVTAIWISPPVDNVNVKKTSDDFVAPYHGYHARDFKTIEEHFGDVRNSWKAFDDLVTAAHQNGIKVIVDFAPNHSNPNGADEKGALYDNGVLLGNYTEDTNQYFHHNPGLDDPNDRYQIQYYNLYDLADINQENPVMDAYLKAAAQDFQRHGVDGFRIDGIKHVPPAWTDTLANWIFSFGDSFLFGEWYLENRYENPLAWDYALSNSIYSSEHQPLFRETYPANISDPLYPEAQRLANRTGLSLLDFPLNTAMRDVFGSDADFNTIDAVLAREEGDFNSAGDLVTFIDNHDLPRFLSVSANQNRLHQALAFMLTARGIPCIYYGTEQYLHNDTQGGTDPYNRPMMAGFETTTVAYQLVNKLATLRRSNPSIPYGSMATRWVSGDVYVYERTFAGSVLLVAINKNETSATKIESLRTTLPPGTYSDHLNGLTGGSAITVDSKSGQSAIADFTVPPHSVSVWQFTANEGTPEVGAVGPFKGQPGMRVTIGGGNFGATAGSVNFGATPAAIVSWSPTKIVCTTPAVQNGIYEISVVTSSNQISNRSPYTVLTANLIPVTVTVHNAPASPGEYLFLTGTNIELGNWASTWDGTIGPMLAPQYPDWILSTSLPAGQTIRFKVIKLDTNGAVSSETSQDHEYTVPASGIGHIELNWQN